MRAVRPVLGLTLALCVACTSTKPGVRKPAGTNDAERVLVVVNQNSAASEEVGAYYMRRRAIPASHLLRISVSDKDEISELALRTDIIAPISAAISRLPVRIDFVVLTTGIPLRTGGRHGYSVDANVAGMQLTMPPMVGFDTAWTARYRSPYYGSRDRFNSDQFNMFLVTRLDCAETADCRALVDRCLAARPVRGPFFFDGVPDKPGNDGYTTLNRHLFATANRLRQGGAIVQLDSTGRFVAPSTPVMGYVSWGSNDVGFDSVAYHAVRFLPGALAETFVSTSGRTFRPTSGGQSRIVDLIQQGVTGVKGYVSEPYTLALANPDILFDRYLRGFNLAEAFYAASLMVLWKDLVVGDPLCAPYANGWIAAETDSAVRR